MATHPKKAKGDANGLSPLYVVVIRALESGAWRHAQLARVMSPHLGGDAFSAFIRRMESDGWITARKGGWLASPKGLGLLPSRQHLPPMKPLQHQVVPPRRPGSNHDHIPSIAAGRERTYRHPI